MNWNWWNQNGSAAVMLCIIAGMLVAALGVAAARGDTDAAEPQQDKPETSSDEQDNPEEWGV